MARIKCEINEDSTLVKFKCLRDGEVFICDNEPYIKAYSPNPKAVSLESGYVKVMDGERLVTYVEKAELNLTI